MVKDTRISTSHTCRRAGAARASDGLGGGGNGGSGGEEAARALQERLERRLGEVPRPPDIPENALQGVSVDRRRTPGRLPPVTTDGGARRLAASRGRRLRGSESTVRADTTGTAPPTAVGNLPKQARGISAALDTFPFGASSFGSIPVQFQRVVESVDSRIGAREVIDTLEKEVASLNRGWGKDGEEFEERAVEVLTAGDRGQASRSGRFSCSTGGISISGDGNLESRVGGENDGSITRGGKAHGVAWATPEQLEELRRRHREALARLISPHVETMPFEIRGAGW